MLNLGKRTVNRKTRPIDRFVYIVTSRYTRFVAGEPAFRWRVGVIVSRDGAACTFFTYIRFFYTPSSTSEIAQCIACSPPATNFQKKKQSPKPRIKAGDGTCFQIYCLLAEVTHAMLWRNRYNWVDKYPLYWIRCRYAVQWFNCRPGLLRHYTCRCRGFLAFSWTFSLWP